MIPSLLRRAGTRLFTAAALVTALTVAAPAQAGRSCEDKPPTVDSLRRSLALAVNTADALDATGAQVVVLARAGQDLRRYGLRWSHLGFAYKASAIGADGTNRPVWRVVHKLNTCGSDSGRLYRQGLGDFFSDDPLPTCEEYVEQLPFVIKDRLQGATLELMAEGEIAAKLVDRWREMLSWIFANTLVSQVTDLVTLPSVATEPAGIAFGTAATPLYNALANIESEFAERMYSRSGVIFLPPGLIGNAMDTYGVEWRDGSYRTPVGNRVIVDPGFYNADAPTGETASGTAEEWVYASGPVYYQASTAEFDEVRAGRVGITDRNLINAFAQSSGIMVFDPCPVTAVLTSYDPE